MRVRQCVDKYFCEQYNFEIERSSCNEWECLSGDWGEWTPCEDGWHNRERCDEEWNCEFEEEECEEEDAMVYSKEWAEWGGV